MKTIALILGAVLAVQPFNVIRSPAQDITRVSPNGLVTRSFDRTPEGITISREGPRRSFSFSIGHGTNPTATASANATGTNFAYASAKTSARVVTNANGQSIDIARARAVAKGNISTSTSAHTTN
jgi:hypothetical protein